MAKFSVGQIVILARPHKLLAAKGSMCEIVAGSGKCQRMSKYAIDVPGFENDYGNTRYCAYGHQLDPLDNTDDRTKAKSEELIFPNHFNVKV